MTKKEHAEFVARRAQLMAELFLEDLDADFVARATDPNFYDFLIGFSKRDGGIDTYAVEVKSTEQPITERWPVSRNLFNRAVNSNIPVLLLVIDVKQNQYYYTWPSDHKDGDANRNTVMIPLTRINDETRASLVTRMVGGAKARAVQATSS